MILLIAIIIGVTIGVASGGSLAGFRTARLRYLPVLFGLILVQAVIFSSIAGRSAFIHRVGPWIHVATLLGTLWVMSRNTHIPGMKVIMVGAALNILVIVANGGFMPSRESTLAAAGRTEMAQPSTDAAGQRPIFSNSTVAANDARLIWDRNNPLLILGDMFAVPKGWPLANVFSIGDVLIAIGASIAIVRVMHAAPPEDDPARQLRASRDSSA